MEITPLLWGITIAAIVGLLAFDYFFHVRKSHLPTIREAAIWSAIYVGIALLFGLMFFAVGDTTHAVEYYAGYITEKALSVDNLFVFLVIMASFKVPREYQQKVLLFGITFALISRTIFILLGAAIIEARGSSSAASAASATIDHTRDWLRGSAENDWVSMAVTSDGSYGVSEGLISSFPVTTRDGGYEIVQGLEIDEFSRGRIDASVAELAEERDAVSQLGLI